MTSFFNNATPQDIKIEPGRCSYQNVEIKGRYIKWLLEGCWATRQSSKTIAAHFLKNGYFISTVKRLQNPNCYEIEPSTCLKPVPVNHDPKPNEAFTLFVSFYNPLNLHVHAFKHCIADYWMHRKSKAHILSDKSEEFFSSFWKEFQQKVGCNYFAGDSVSDLSDPEQAQRIFAANRGKSAEQAIEKAKRASKPALKSLSDLKIVKQCFDGDEKNICANCIDKHNGPRTFLRCWDLLSNYEIHKIYLDNIHNWISQALQDSENLSLYAGKTQSQNPGPNRRHVHYRQNGQDYIRSYFLENREGRCAISTQLFKKNKNKQSYDVLTAFVMKEMKTTESAKHFLHDAEIKRASSGATHLAFCHESNWDQQKSLRQAQKK